METRDLKRLFDLLWKDYSQLNPQALKIHQLLEARNEKIQNDHIAFRTFDDSRVNLAKFQKVFEDFGYFKNGEYDFPVKKLKAIHFEHENPIHPKIFVSELVLSEFSVSLQNHVAGLLDQIPSSFSASVDFVTSGRPWTLSQKTYQDLLNESEYAGWMSAFGFRVNHFTVLFNSLKSFKDLAELNLFLKQAGFPLNSSGGEIKGTPEELLEQSSTLAAEVLCDFEEGSLKIPSCYYEFARRYPDKEGKMFQGFIAKSADKIFESTNRQIS